MTKNKTLRLIFYDNFPILYLLPININNEKNIYIKIYSNNEKKSTLEK